MRVHVKISAKELYTFSLFNSYTGFNGVVSVLFTVGSLALLVRMWNEIDMFQKAMLVLCALIFTVIQPISLYSKSKKQAEHSGISDPMDLTFTDEKITVEQRGISGDVSWDDIWKAVELRSMYILRIGPQRGFLIPKAAIDGPTDKFVAILKKNLPASKTKGLKS